MAPSLPFPLRVVAGIVARGVETARRIPGDLPGLGVEIAGNAAKVAMVVRNELTDLAIRGDELLAGSTEPEDSPSWATFDDDDPAPRTDAGHETDPAHEPDAASVSHPASEYDADTGAGIEDGAAGSGVSEDGATVHPLTEDELAADTAATSSEHLAVAGTVLPGYTMLTVAQLRGHLGHLSVADVRVLLRHEQDGAARPAYVTLLTNRISTLEHAAGGSR